MWQTIGYITANSAIVVFFEQILFLQIFKILEYNYIVIQGNTQFYGSSCIVLMWISLHIGKNKGKMRSKVATIGAKWKKCNFMWTKFSLFVHFVPATLEKRSSCVAHQNYRTFKSGLHKIYVWLIQFLWRDNYRYVLDLVFVIYIFPNKLVKK